MFNHKLNCEDLYKSFSVLSQFGIEIKNWPNIVILGQQNEGKSSLIEAITQVQILPKSEGLCTRKPIYMTLINNPESKILIGDTQFSETEAAAEVARLNLQPKIERINCTIMSPYVYNCSIIDTVGLIHISNEMDPKKIKQETIEYLKDKNNVFVLVSSAPSDLANSQILQLIKKYEREDDTLGVMTKIDLVENQSQTMVSEILNGNQYKLGFGWIPTKLRSDRDTNEGITIEESITREYEYCQSRPVFSSVQFGVTQIRKTISMIQLEKIKHNIPLIIQEVDSTIKTLKSSQHFLERISDESDNTLANKLALMIEKLVGTSHERSQFEVSLKREIKTFLLDYMDKVFNKDGTIESLVEYNLENDKSENFIDVNIYDYHVKNTTVAQELSDMDDVHEMLNSGLISPLGMNDHTLQKAYEKEITIATLMPIFELKVDDPHNIKKMAWNKYLEKYFSSLQQSSVLQNQVYSITERMLLEYINNDNNDEISKHFTEYIIRNIGQNAFEEKMRYSIGSLVNIEQRPYVSVYDVIRQIILITKSPYLDYLQFYTIRRMFGRPNCNKITLTLYSDLWNRIYLMTVIDRLALNCYRIVAVNLVNKMVENLLSMVISLNKENSQKEGEKISDKISVLNYIKEQFALVR